MGWDHSLRSSGCVISATAIARVMGGEGGALKAQQFVLGW